MKDRQTLMEAFDFVVDANRDRPALKFKQGGEWRTRTWNEYREEVHKAARALIHLGVEPSSGVAIIGFNCPQWVIAHMGAVHAGGRPTGIYTTNTPEQCHYIAEHCGARVVFVENREHLAKFKEVRDRLPELRAIVMMYGDDADPAVYSWQTFLKLADEVPESTLLARIERQRSEDVCAYIYTSGTTGEPKAVMLTHDNVTFNPRITFGALGFVPGDCVISYLPLSHIGEQIVSLYGPLYSHATVWFAESLEALGDNLREVRPTLFLAVPRVWEKMQSKIIAAGAQNSGLKKRISAWARSVGRASAEADQRGTSRPFLHPLAEKVVFSKVRERLGLDRARVLVSSAAPISLSTVEFFHSLGMAIMECFGMSEVTGLSTVSLPQRYKSGTVGYSFRETELRIADDGELLVRGRHVFKGYLKNEQATREAIDADNWLHTGDLGSIDSDGFVKITGRKKDLLITAGGENIAPQMIEERLRGIAAISQAVVVGDGRKHLSALLALDETRLEITLGEAGCSAKTLADAATDPKLNEWLMAQVEVVNRSLARVQTIKKVAVLPRELTIDGGELTPTMKVRRKQVNERYAGLIEAFYASSEG